MAYPATYRYTKEHEWIDERVRRARWASPTTPRTRGRHRFCRSAEGGSTARRANLWQRGVGQSRLRPLFARHRDRVEVNEELATAPEKINTDAHGTWILKVELTDPSEVDQLLKAADYEKFVQGRDPLGDERYRRTPGLGDQRCAICQNRRRTTRDAEADRRRLDRRFLFHHSSGVPAGAGSRGSPADGGVGDCRLLSPGVAENAAGYASFLGAGAYRHYRPVIIDSLVQRGEFLTSYTPYQAEIIAGDSAGHLRVPDHDLRADRHGHRQRVDV